MRIDSEYGEPFLLAITIQDEVEPGKPGAWACYLSAVYAKYQLPPVLLVLCQDHAVAAWASRPVLIDSRPEFGLVPRPRVLGPHNMPVHTKGVDRCGQVSVR